MPSRVTGYYTYLHLKADTREIFYVGKGKVSRCRANSHLNRTLHWRNMVAKHGLLVEIAAYWEDEEAAYEHECLLIACLRDMGVRLVNLTDGGDGVRGHRHSDEYKAWQSDRMKMIFATDEAYRERHRLAQRERFADPATREEHGEVVRQAWTPEKRTAAAQRWAAQCAAGKHPCQKITDSELEAMVALRLSGVQLKDVAARFSFSRTHAGTLIRNRILSAHPSLKVCAGQPPIHLPRKELC